LGLIWYIKTHNLFNIEILNEMQYSTEIRKEAVLNIISNEDKMWMNLKGRTRRAIRKSVKNGVQLYEGKDSDLDKYYEMVCETYKRSNSQPPPKKLIFEAYRILFPVKMIKLFFAEYNGELIAALMPTIYKKKIYYWGGADLGTHRNLQPMSFLFWELIKWAKSNHHQKLDFLGIDNPRFEKFKCSWGGSIESHHSCVKKSRKLKFLRMFLGRR